MNLVLEKSVKKCKSSNVNCYFIWLLLTSWMKRLWSTSFFTLKQKIFIFIIIILIIIFIIIIFFIFIFIICRPIVLSCSRNQWSATWNPFSRCFKHFIKFSHDFFLRRILFKIASCNSNRECSATTKIYMRFVIICSTTSPTSIHESLIIFKCHLCTIKSTCHPFSVLTITASTKSVSMNLIYIY